MNNFNKTTIVFHAVRWVSYKKTHSKTNKFIHLFHIYTYINGMIAIHQTYPLLYLKLTKASAILLLLRQIGLSRTPSGTMQRSTTSNISSNQTFPLLVLQISTCNQNFSVSRYKTNTNWNN